MTLAVDASGMLRVWAFDDDDQAGAVPLVPGTASVWVFPVWPLNQLSPDPDTPSACALDPSQYLI